eukprot:1088361-Amphidinium_carterae.1
MKAVGERTPESHTSKDTALLLLSPDTELTTLSSESVFAATPPHVHAGSTGLDSARKAVRVESSSRIVHRLGSVPAKPTTPRLEARDAFRQAARLVEDRKHDTSQGR